MKKFLSVLLITVLLFSAGGCVRKDTPPKKSKLETIELTYYKLFDDEDVMKPIIQQYMSKNPNIQIKYKKFTDPAEYENLIINELAEGEGPDIFSVPNYWFLRNVKKIQPLPVNKMSTKQFADTFVSVASNDLVLRDPADSEIKVFGIPMFVDTLSLYYNKAQFDDKIPSRGKPAATWESLKDDVYSLTKKDQSFERFELSGIAMGRADNVARAFDILSLLMLQYGVDFYNDNISQAQFSRQSTLSSMGLSINPAAEALKLYTSFALPANKNYSWNSYLADAKSSLKEMETFAKGKVSMIFGYSYLYEQIKNEIKDLKDKGISTIDIKDVQIAAVPQVIDPQTSTDKRVALANYYAETVSRTSAHPDEAWDFLIFVTSQENLKYYNQKTFRPTSRRDLIQDQLKNPVYGVFAEQIGYAESLPIYDYTSYEAIFATAINSILSTQSITDAIKTAEQKINALLPPGGMLPPAPAQKIETPGAIKNNTAQNKTTQQPNK